MAAPAKNVRHIRFYGAGLQVQAKAETDEKPVRCGHISSGYENWPYYCQKQQCPWVLNVPCISLEVLQHFLQKRSRTFTISCCRWLISSYCSASRETTVTQSQLRQDAGSCLQSWGMCALNRFQKLCAAAAVIFYNQCGTRATRYFRSTVPSPAR